VISFSARVGWIVYLVSNALLLCYELPWTLIEPEPSRPSSAIRFVVKGPWKKSRRPLSIGGQCCVGVSMILGDSGQLRRARLSEAASEVLFSKPILPVSSPALHHFR